MCKLCCMNMKQKSHMNFQKYKKEEEMNEFLIPFLALRIDMALRQGNLDHDPGLVHSCWFILMNTKLE